MLVAAETAALSKGKGEGPGREGRGGQEGQDVDEQGNDDTLRSQPRALKETRDSVRQGEETAG